MTRLLIVGDSPFGTSSWSSVVFNLLDEILLTLSSLDIYYLCLDIGMPFQEEPILYSQLPNHQSFNNERFSSVQFHTIYERRNHWKKIYLLSNLHKIDKILVVGDVALFDSYNCGRIKSQTYLYTGITDGLNHHSLESFPDGKNPNSKMLAHLPLFNSIATPYQFGKQVLYLRYDYPVKIIPPLIDTNTFYSTSNKIEIRKQLGITAEAFLILIISKNNDLYDKNGLLSSLDAFQSLSKKDDNIELYLHCPLEGALDVAEKIREYGIQGKVYHTDTTNWDTHLSRGAIVRFYNMADVFLRPSKGEVWGMSILESQHCGTPVVTSKSTCMEEITYFGIVANTEKIISNIPNMITWSHPEVENIVEAITNIKRGIVSSNSLNMDKYKAISIKESWLSFLEIEIEEDIKIDSEEELV